MVWQGTLYMMLVVVALSVSIASALHIWRHRYMPAAKTLIVILLAGTTWILADMLYLSSASQSATIFVLKIAYLPLAIVYVGWFVFTLQYTGRGKWVTRRNLVLLSVIPAITLLLASTIDYHHLMCSSLEIVTEGEFLRDKCIYGPWFYIQAAYAYILVLFGDSLLIHLLIHAPRFYRRQIISLLLVSVLLQLRSVLPMSGLSYLSILTIATMMFSVCCPLLALSVYRFRLADIVPMARGGVIEGMADAVMVLDAQNRVLDVNPIIQKLIGHNVPRLLGRPVAEIWPSWIDQIEPGNEIQEGKEIMLNLEDEQRVYDVRFSPLTDWRGSLVSQVVVLRDITDRKQTEMQLKNIFDASKLINSTIDINEIFEFVSKSVQELVGFDHFMIFLVSKDGNQICRAYAVGDSEDEKELTSQYGEGLVGHCITKKENMLLRNAYTDERESIPDGTGPMSQIVIPLIIENEAVGALYISKNVENAYGNHDVDVLKPLSEIMSSAIRNSSLYTEAKELNAELESKIKERSKRIEILVSTRQNLQRETSLQRGLMTIVDSMKMFGFDKVGVFLVDPKGEELVFHSGTTDNLSEINTSIPLENKEYLGVQCVLEKKTIHVKDARLTEGTQIDESTSFTWVPIVVQDEAFAALTACNMNKVVTDEDVKDLEILAGMCAAFIDRTRVQIEPVAENHLKTEITHQLTPRECYLILEKTPKKSFEIFVDLVTHGISGFVVSREYPEKIKEKYHLVKTPMLWLSRAEREIAINPVDLPKLIYIIGDFTRKSEESVVLLDGLEYLITQNTFEAVLKFLQELRDIIILNNSRLILPLHKETLSQKEYSKIEREFSIFD